MWGTPDHRGSPGPEDRRDGKGRPETAAVVTSSPEGYRACQDTKASRAPAGSRDGKETQAILGLMASPAFQGSRVPLGRLEPLGPKEQKETPEPLPPKVIGDSQEFQACPA